MTRNFILMPLILLYMGILLIAAWPREIRPISLHGEHEWAERVLESVGIRAGMAVFSGTPEKMPELVVGRCTLATGIDARGRRRRIYPKDPCPPEGERLTPVVYEHMIVHATAKLNDGDRTASLSVLGDHFCQQENDPNIDRVLLELEISKMDYLTGEKTTGLHRLGVVKCRY